MAGVVHAVSHNEGIRNDKADVIGLDLDGAAGRFVEQDAGAKRAWTRLEDESLDGLKGPAGIKDVVNYQNMTILEIGRWGAANREVARNGTGAIA